jgi:hypothetical protein
LNAFLGAAIRVRHIRNGTELPPLFQDNSYDFNYQSPIVFETPKTLAFVSFA